MNEKRIFHLSKKERVRLNWRTWTILAAWALAFLLDPELLQLFGQNFRFAFIMTGSTFFLLFYFLYWYSRKFWRRFPNGPILETDESGLKRTDRKWSVFMNFSDLVSLRILRDRHGSIKKLTLLDHRRAMHLWGFENLEEIVELIREKASGTLNISEKKTHIDWTHPLVWFLFMLSLFLYVSLPRFTELSFFLVFGLFLVAFGGIITIKAHFNRGRLLGIGLALLGFALLLTPQYISV